jgi:ribose transport system ATP-binding protein
MSNTRWMTPSQLSSRRGKGSMLDRLSSSGALGAPVVTLESVDLSYGAVKALNGATFAIHPGECVGLVGHNGAGKSTLVNVLNGRLSPTSGKVSYDLGAAATKTSNAEAASTAGIRSVFQELSLCPNLTVLENYRVPYRRMPWWRWRSAARTAVLIAINEIFPEHNISPDASVGDLTIAERQMVEIAVAFSMRDSGPRLVILDEPTSSLDAGIANQLIKHIQRFCAAGNAVIFISHMMGEVFEVATRIAVMKDGNICQDRPTSEFTRDTIVEAMGHVVAGGGSSPAARKSRSLGKEVVRLENGLSANQGEIVGLAGLAGHGQAEALAQLYFTLSSSWRFSGQRDVAFVAGDRIRDGIMPIWSILRNLTFATLPDNSERGLLDTRREQALANKWKDKIDIKATSVDSPILSLSGGNQQKVLFSRALASRAQLVLMDDPMRGVDVGTKKEVYSMIRAEAEAGRTFLWYSTETDEVLQCDRVFVFRAGSIAAELVGDEITEENLLRASFRMQEAAT